MPILVARCYWDFQTFKTCVKLRSAEIFVTLFYSRPTDVIFTLYCLLLHYTCQLFLTYKREIFILGGLGFLKTTRSFPKIPEEFRSLPKATEVCRSLPKASWLPVLFTSSQTSRGRYCHLFILHMVFVPYMGLS